MAFETLQGPADLPPEALGRLLELEAGDGWYGARTGATLRDLLSNLSVAAPNAWVVEGCARNLQQEIEQGMQEGATSGQFRILSRELLRMLRECHLFKTLSFKDADACLRGAVESVSLPHESTLSRHDIMRRFAVCAVALIITAAVTALIGIEMFLGGKNGANPGGPGGGPPQALPMNGNR
jgi:hypothetical protein